MKKVLIVASLVTMACFSSTLSYAEMPRADEDILSEHQLYIEKLVPMATALLERVRASKGEILRSLEKRDQFPLLLGLDGFELNAKMAKDLYEFSDLERKCHELYKEVVRQATMLCILKGAIYTDQGLDYLKSKSSDNGRTYQLTDQDFVIVGLYSQKALEAFEQAVELDPDDKDFQKILMLGRLFWGQFKKDDSASAK